MLRWVVAVPLVDVAVVHDEEPAWMAADTRCGVCSRQLSSFLPVRFS